MIKYFAHAFVPSAALAIVTLCGFIPYIGGFIQGVFAQILGLIMFVFVGLYLAEEASDKGRAGKLAFVILGIVMCSLAQVAPHVTRYYALPFVLSISEDIDVTYEEARRAQQEYLVSETGSGGLMAVAILSEREQLTGESLSYFFAGQIEGAGGLGGLIVAIINVVLHSIPVILTWLLVAQLGVVGEPGVIGLVYWYLLSVTIALFVYRIES